MITHNQRTRYSYRSRLMALPVLALVFCSIALYAQRSANSVTPTFHPGSTQKSITVVIDAGHGGPDNGATSADGKYLEKNLALQISQKIQQLASSYNVNVVMTRTDDNLPGGTTVIHDGLRARTAITEKAKADLFIAIHVSATGESTTTESGFEVYVGNKDDNKNTQLSKQLGTVLLQELSKVYQTNTALLQRQSKGIWVLEKSPCPAVLIECGFITNDKDVAFFSNSSNQETIAKKILEGIVNYKNKPSVAINTPASTAAPVAQAAPVKKPATPAVTVTPARMELPVTQNQPVQTAVVKEAITPEQEPDPMITKISRHLNRNIRYPEKARAGTAIGNVYFSVAVDKNGNFSNIQFYDEAPANASPLNKVITVSYYIKSPAIEKLPAEEGKKLFLDEVKRVLEKKPDLSNCPPQAEQYFFRAEFKLYEEQPRTV